MPHNKEGMDTLKIALAFVLGALAMLVAVNLTYNNPATSSLVSPDYCPMMQNRMTENEGYYCGTGVDLNESGCMH